MNPPPAHQPPTTNHRLPSSGLRRGLGLRKLSDPCGHPAAHLNLNESAPPSPISHLPSPTRLKAAFTLIELMVAAAITTLLLLGMTGIFDQAMKAWRLSSRRADAEREVRATLNTIQRDVRSLWSDTNVPVYRLTQKPAIPYVGPSKDPEYSQSVALFFLTRLSTNQQPDPANDRGDLCGVGYYVAWDDSANNGKGAYHLYRYLQGSSRQTQNLRAFLQDPRVVTDRDGLFPSTAPRTDEIVGAHVVNFRAEFKTVPPVLGSTNVLEHPGPLILARRGIWSLTIPSTVTLSNSEFVSTNRIGQGANSNNAIAVSLETANIPAAARTTFPTNTVMVSGMSYVQLELTAYGAEAVRNFSSSNDWLNSDNIRKFGRAFLWRVDL